MANESWVGFARSPKPDASLVAAEYEFELTCALPLVELFACSTSADGMSQWLAKSNRADVRTSGKVEFVIAGQVELALFSSVELGKRAILNSEAFGEIAFDFKSQKSESELKIKFTKLVEPASREQYLEQARISCSRLAELVAKS